MTINSILSLCWTTNYNYNLTGKWLRAEVPCCTCQSRHNSASSLYLALPEKSRRDSIFRICLKYHIIGVYKILLFLLFLQRQTFVQGKHYLFLEVTSQLHRQLVPLQVLICLPRTLNILAILNWYQLYGYLQPWLMYLLAASDEQGPASIPNKVWSKWFFCGLQLEDWALFTLDHVLNDLLQVLGVFLTAAYMVVKGRIFMRALKLWRAAFYKLLQSTR